MRFSVGYDLDSFFSGLQNVAGNIVYLLELQGVRCHDQVIRLQ